MPLLPGGPSPDVVEPGVPVQTDSGCDSGEEDRRDSRQSDGFDLPRIRLEIRDLDHRGASQFLTALHASTALTSAIRDVLASLYVSPGHPTTTPPPTRSVTLVLRDMPGVAHTTGTDLDPDHKEIHLSLRYVSGIRPRSRLADEITGVLVHEVVHCYQHNGFDTCPGGLVEGVADWVRLRRGLAPPHWRRRADERGWDAGYDRTAYFLDYLEDRFGEGTVRRLNEKLRIQRYEETTFWTELLGRPVQRLWTDYVAGLEEDEGADVPDARGEDSSDEVVVETPSTTSQPS